MTNITTRRWKTWASDASEHAVRAGATGVILNLGLSEGSEVGLNSFTSWEPWSYGIGAVILSVLMSLAGKRRGNPSTASLRQG